MRPYPVSVPFKGISRRSGREISALAVNEVVDIGCAENCEFKSGINC